MSLVPYKVTAIKKTDPTGNNVLPLASVAIVKSGGGYAQLWDDEAGTIARGNPFQVDANGERQVWLNGGEYSVSVAGGQSWDIKLTGGSDILSIENVSALSGYAPIVGRLYRLKEYNLGTGKGGGDLLAKSGSITPNNVTTFASATAGVYFERVNLKDITLEMAGVYDPAENNVVAIKAACQAASDLLLPLVQVDDNYYGVSGNLNLNSTDNLKIYGLSLKQLTPSAAVRTIFKNSGVGHIELYGVRVDRNGTADASDPQSGTDAAGVWLQNFNGLKIDGLEVFGDGQGTGIYINNVIARGVWNNLYVHDITWWSAATPTTEKLGGIGILDSSKFTLQNFRVENLYSKTGADPVRRYQTDGIGIGGTAGCSRFTVRDGYIANVGEGLDITGSGGNTDFKIFNIFAEDCGTASYKFANGNNTGEIHGLTSVRAGQAGIGIVGTGASALQPVGNFFIHHCFIYDTGANPEVSGGAITYDGIQLQEAATQPNAPFNTILSDLIIADRQTVKTMDYGIRRYETVFSGQNLILGDNIIIQGAKVADVASRGVPNTLGKYMFSSAQTTAAITHTTSGTWQTFLLPVAEYDDNGLYNVATGVFTIKTSGLYEINAFVSFTSNATGYRGLRCRVTKAPSAISVYASDVKSAVSGDSTSCQVKRNVMLAAGDTVVFEFNQTSGAALNTNTASNFAQVTLLKV